MNPPRSKPVIVFDGQCQFCNNQVARIRRMDPADQFEYLPSQSPELLERYPQLANSDLNTGMRLIEENGKVLVGADAVHGIANHLPRWRKLTWLYNVPGIHAISKLGYKIVAANRQRLGKTCENDACQITPQRKS